MAWRWYGTDEFNPNFMETIMRWLLSEMKLETCEENPKDRLIKLIPNNLHSKSEVTSNALDVALCFFSTLGATLVTWKSDCQKIFGR